MKDTEANIDNKRIARNTIYLYIRMFVMLGISLYTARVIIRTLGIDDYGIYNIIGGVVILFSFISNSLRSAFQRFLSFELGRKELGDIHSVFFSSITIVIIFSIFFIVLSETLGLWFVCNKLNIPQERYNAALWIFQFSILSFVFNLFQTPFQAAVVSYEKFSFYAVYSIVDVILKLIIAFSIVVYRGDKLILYGALISGVNLINLATIGVFTKRRLKVGVHFNSDRKTFKSIFSYSSWAMLNSSSVIISQQGGNILLNIFNGVVANGAYGIANQISAAVFSFVSNFQNAFNPQIIKSYASQEYDAMFILSNRCSLFSYYLLLIITIPFFINCDYLLYLWLGENPPYATGFCLLMLVYFLIDAFQAPLWMIIAATGKMRDYQIWTGIITLFNIPISALLLYIGYSIYWMFIIRVILNIGSSIYRILYLKHLLPKFSLTSYIQECVAPIIKVTGIILIIIYGLNMMLNSMIILNILSVMLISILVIWTIGISNVDRKALISLVRNKTTKN